jgi:predicted metal-binding protein
MKENITPLLEKYPFQDFKWINPHEIIVSQWVRMKCIFGCDEYGRTAACPPNVPSIDECRIFFKEFTTGIVFHFQECIKNPKDRQDWSRKINLKLLALEREIFLSGYHKTFLLFMDSCTLCSNCRDSRKECKRPFSSRPSPEGLGVDVFSTVRQWGLPIDVLKDYSQPMNRYAFILIE